MPTLTNVGSNSLADLSRSEATGLVVGSNAFDDADSNNNPNQQVRNPVKFINKVTLKPVDKVDKRTGTRCRCGYSDPK
jgi:hypothetical protein